MILHEAQPVAIAEADWEDDGTVTLLTFPATGEHHTSMVPSTARALAKQLTDAAEEAERAAGDVDRQRVARAMRHAFDTDGPSAA